MNFEHIPELKWLYGYPFALGLMVVTTLVLLFFFWRSGWISFPKKRARRLRM